MVTVTVGTATVELLVRVWLPEKEIAPDPWIVPVLLPPLLSATVPVLILSVPVLLNTIAKLVIPVPAVLLTMPRLLKVTRLPPVQDTSPCALKLAPLRFVTMVAAEGVEMGPAQFAVPKLSSVRPESTLPLWS